LSGIITVDLIRPPAGESGKYQSARPNPDRPAPNKQSAMKPLLPLLAFLLALPADAQLALIRQGRESRGAAETGDFFGFAVCAGDFNNDGYDDLATGAPYEHLAGLTSTQAGYVTINRGSRFGLTWVGAVGITAGGGGLATTETHHFGYALASADFNGDEFDDLAVGLPGSSVSGFGSAGRVMIFLGGPDGIGPTASQVLTQSVFGAVSESGDRFGAALAAGRLGTDNFADLVIGGPGENGGDGAIFIIRGGATGLVTTQTSVVQPADIGADGGAFGSALAVGNVIGLSHADVLVGAPDTDAGILQNTGAVHLLIGNPTTVSTVNAQHFDAAADGEFYQTNGKFGASVAVGDFFADDGELDLVIGSPGRYSGKGTMSLARGGLLAIQWVDVFTPYANEENASYGLAVAAGDWDGDGDDDAAVGSPYTDISSVNSGQIVIFFGSPDGFLGWTRFDEADCSAGYAINSHMGSSLAFGRFGQGLRAGLAIGCPGRDGGRGQVLDLSPWRQVEKVQCTSALAVDCEDRIIFALRPFEQVSIASTTKIMTVLLACEATARPLFDPFRVGLDEEYTIEPWMQIAYPPTTGCSAFTYFSPAFDRYTLRELMHSAIIPSGNDSCYAIADAITGEIDAWETGPAPIFISMMNDRAASIGMEDTLFASASGATDAPAHYSTAYDMWLLGREAMRNPLFREMASTTDFDVPKLVPGAEAGIFEEAVAQLSYGWLKSLQAIDPRIVGLKPGSTGGAGRTGVVAARQTVPPYELAFATGFGWADSATAIDQLAALVQLAIAECDPDYSAPGGLASAPAERLWTMNDSLRSEVTVLELGRPGDVEDDGITVVLHPTPDQIPSTIERGQSPLVHIRYNTLWELAPGQTATVIVDPISSLRATLADAVGGWGASQYQYAIADTTFSITLPAAGSVTLPPWSSRSAEACRIAITNVGTQTTACVLETVGTVQPDFLWFATGGGTHRVQIHNDTTAVRTSCTVREAPLASNLKTAFPMTVAVDDPARGQPYRPPVDLSDFMMSESGTGGPTLLDLGWKADATGEFYAEYEIQASPSLNSSSWQRLARVRPADGGVHSWSGSAPAANRNFVRIIGVPAQ
jgi:hypothetical protein